jgi:hypothetical protein
MFTCFYLPNTLNGKQFSFLFVLEFSPRLKKITCIYSSYRECWSEKSLGSEDNIFSVLNYVINLCAMKAYGEWRYCSTILNLDTRWRLVVNFTLLPLYPRENSPVTRWIGGWVCPRADLDAMEKSEISCLCRKSNPGYPARSLLTIAATHTWDDNNRWIILKWILKNRMSRYGLEVAHDRCWLRPLRTR